jgi:hypothetical protein
LNKTALATTIVICVLVSSAVSIATTYLLISQINHGSPSPTSTPEQTNSSTPEPTQTQTPEPTTVVQPSIPEFTVEFVDRSYIVPTTNTTTTDPFTGKQVTTSSGGQKATNRNIDIKIKNQPYSDIVLKDGNVVKLYLVVRTKGHFTDWSANANSGYSFTRILASSSDYTVVTLVIGRENDIAMGNADVFIPGGSQEDFEVSAQAGYEYEYYNGHIFPIGTEFELLAESGWSNIQTITVP